MNTTVEGMENAALPWQPVSGKIILPEISKLADDVGRNESPNAGQLTTTNRSEKIGGDVLDLRLFTVFLLFNKN